MNIVHLCDCMTFMATCKDKQYDLAIVDPPYGIGRFWEGGDSKGFNYGKNRQSNRDWNIKAPDKEYYDELKRISNNQIIWGWNYYTEYLGSSDSLIFWDKRMGAPNYSDGEIAWTSFNHKIKMYVEARNRSKQWLSIHPCQKPVALYKWLLTNYAKPGQTIFDSHVGSGSIRIACHDLGFDFEGCELDPDYHAAQEKRYQDHIAQGELFEKEEIQKSIYNDGDLFNA